VDDSLEEGLRRLGLAINDAVTGSAEVTGALEEIRARGTDVFLVLEATICIRRGAEEPPLEAGDDASEIEMSAEDVQFLRRLRISVDDEN
jgi:hypothetical protein